MPQIYDSNLVGKKESVVDQILLLNPHQTPLINMLGFSTAVSQTTHQWFEDEMFATETTVNGAKLVTDTTITVADASMFRVGDVVKIGEELLKITSMAGNDLTVARGYAGTTAVAIADASKVEFQFVEGVEGNDARQARYKERVPKSNKTQIFDDTIQISGTAQSVTQYGITDLYAYEKDKKQLELALQLEKALINGVEYENGQVRQMRGIRNFIQSNVTNVGGALTIDAINDLAQDIYEQGGFANGGRYVLIVPAKQKRAISKFQGDQVRFQQVENIRGQVVDTIATDFGEFEVNLNNNLSSDELFLVDANRIAIRPLVGREFFHKYMGEQGDYTTGIVVGEYTLEFKQEKAHGRLKGLA